MEVIDLGLQRNGYDCGVWVCIVAAAIAYKQIIPTSVENARQYIASQILAAAKGEEPATELPPEVANALTVTNHAQAGLETSLPKVVSEGAADKFANDVQLREYMAGLWDGEDEDPQYDDEEEDAEDQGDDDDHISPPPSKVASKAVVKASSKPATRFESVGRATSEGDES